ncbi:hypothetical protein DPMN_157767 [Dreissena polymorpha]|uniref:Uncharacterized protein n=1 Tax=Dreissena polymorpha TaxID=45954 RepID=A0A9D4IQB1_DREPO|nr:hypothetical protein DPMN_157767 [Dreissena polymorpha]
MTCSRSGAAADGISTLIGCPGAEARGPTLPGSAPLPTRPSSWLGPSSRGLLPVEWNQTIGRSSGSLN